MAMLLNCSGHGMAWIHPSLLWGGTSWKRARRFAEFVYSDTGSSSEAAESPKFLCECVNWSRVDEWVLGQQLVQIQLLGLFFSFFVPSTQSGPKSHPLCRPGEDTSRQPTSCSRRCQQAHNTNSTLPWTFAAGPSLVVVTIKLHGFGMMLFIPLYRSTKRPLSWRSSVNLSFCCIWQITTILSFLLRLSLACDSRDCLRSKKKEKKKK